MREGGSGGRESLRGFRAADFFPSEPAGRVIGFLRVIKITFLVHFLAIHTSAFLRRQLFPEVFIICFFFLKQFINKNFLAILRRLSENQSLMDHIVFFQNLLSPVVV